MAVTITGGFTLVDEVNASGDFSNATATITENQPTGGAGARGARNREDARDYDYLNPPRIYEQDKSKGRTYDRELSKSRLRRTGALAKIQAFVDADGASVADIMAQIKAARQMEAQRLAAIAKTERLARDAEIQHIIEQGIAEEEELLIALLCAVA